MNYSPPNTSNIYVHSRQNHTWCSPNLVPHAKPMSALRFLDLANPIIRTCKTDAVLEAGSCCSLCHLVPQGSLFTSSHNLPSSFPLTSAPFSFLSLNNSHSLFIYAPFARHLLLVKLSPTQHNDFPCRLDW